MLSTHRTRNEPSACRPALDQRSSDLAGAEEAAAEAAEAVTEEDAVGDAAVVVADEVTVGEDAVAGAGDDVYIDNVLDLARGLRRYLPVTVFGRPNLPRIRTIRSPVKRAWLASVRDPTSRHLSFVCICYDGWRRLRYRNCGFRVCARDEGHAR